MPSWLRNNTKVYWSFITFTCSVIHWMFATVCDIRCLKNTDILAVWTFHSQHSPHGLMTCSRLAPRPTGCVPCSETPVTGTHLTAPCSGTSPACSSCSSWVAAPTILTPFSWCDELCCCSYTLSWFTSMWQWGLICLISAHLLFPFATQTSFWISHLWFNAFPSPYCCRKRRHLPVINILWRQMNVITISLQITVQCSGSLSGKQSACLYSK